MEYRKLGKKGHFVSALGLGFMGCLLRGQMTNLPTKSINSLVHQQVNESVLVELRNFYAFEECFGAF